MGGLITMPPFHAKPKRRKSPLQSWRWQKLRLEVLRRDHHQCQIRLAGCTDYATQVDHIIAVDGEPPDSPLWFDKANLQAACAPCNRRKWSASGEPPPPGGLIRTFNRKEGTRVASG